MAKSLSILPAEKCVWPFGAYEILHIALIVIIPLIVAVLEIKFSIISNRVQTAGQHAATDLAGMLGIDV